MKQIYIYLLIFVIIYIIYRRNIMHYDSYIDFLFYTPRIDTSKGEIVNNVPLKIFLTWETKNLPINMYNNLMLLHKMNPEFDIYTLGNE